MASYYDSNELQKDANRNRKHTCPNCNGDGMTEVYAYERSKASLCGEQSSEQPWIQAPPTDVDLCTLCMGSGFVGHKSYIAYMRRV
jgi:DnaJ-class molecular chaperone